MDYTPGAGDGDWAGGLTDSFDAASVQGTENDITPVDVALMDVLGYHAVTPHILNHVGGGNWSAAGSWNPGNVPGAGDAAYLTYGDGVSRTITYDYTGPAVTLYSLTLDLANATGTAATTLSMSANNLTVNGEEIVGHNGSGYFNQSGGTNTINGENGLFLGFNSGSTGGYSLSGTGSLSVTSNEYIGNAGTGMFIQSGGTNTIAGNLNLGNSLGSAGTYTLSGTATLNINNDEGVGVMGTGTFTQTGGTNTVAETFAAGVNSGVTGTYNLSGGNLTIADEYVGYTGIGTFIQTGGTNTITGSNGGFFRLGRDPGSQGYYTLSVGILNANAEQVGVSGTGTFTQTGGTNTVAGDLDLGNNLGGVGAYTQSGGTNTVTETFAAGVSSGGVGTYNLSGGNLTIADEYVGYTGIGTFIQTGGTNTITGSNGGLFRLGRDAGSQGYYTLSAGTLNANDEQVGVSGTGTFTQTGGTHTVAGTFAAGENSGSTGVFNLSGGTLSVADEYVGYAGAGTFVQTGGANTTGVLDVGNSAGSSGNYTLSAGATNATGSAFVGGSSGGAGGAGTLTVSKTGQLTVAGTLEVYNSGQVNINGGRSTVGGLSIATGGVVNGNSALFINYGRGSDPVAMIRDYLIDGRNGGAWNGVGGINSSAAALPANNAHYGLGYADGADGIVVGLSSGQIEIKYTLLGDTDLNGAVTGSDFTALAGNLGKSGVGWDKGDFLYTGAVTGSDFTALSQNLGKSTSGADVILPAADYAAIDAFAAANGLMADVPEPATIGLFALSIAGMLGRRRRS